VTFLFVDCELEVERRELRRGGKPIALEPQVFDLLVYLIRHRGRVVSKDDLIENIWGGRIISTSTLTSRLNAARKAIGDSGAAQQLIRTVPRRGIRFVGEVREEAPPPHHHWLSLPVFPSRISPITRRTRNCSRATRSAAPSFGSPPYCC
jgi:DNA-binding winged helix-turn-helix (wHTH) protein